MKKRKTNYKPIYILLIIIISLYTILNNFDTSQAITPNNQSLPRITNAPLIVQYIDVGQADSILIENKQEYMLIDGGNNNDGKLLVEYFKEQNIKEFKYIVATHPHEDHIGGLDEIIDNFNVKKIYMPNAITTTKTFEDLLDAIERKNLSFTVPTIGEKFKLGNSTFTVIYTGTDTTDLNNTSIVLKMTYQNTSYLFTGDATEKTEEKILNQDITADILKVGHHGSAYSTTNQFLKKVNPKYAIISVGQDNKYNHPAISTINKLKNSNIKTYRTDQNGTIIIENNNNNITITTKKTNTNGG